MSSHRVKFIKEISLANGDSLKRNDSGAGRWEYHHKAGNPKVRIINDTQASMIDAAIEATFAHVHKVQA